MPNSKGEESEKTSPNQEKNQKTEQNKRKRNRNRKKNAVKVENLVSKTFQEKLASSSKAKKSAEKQTPLQGNIESKVEVKTDLGIKEDLVIANTNKLTCQIISANRDNSKSPGKSISSMEEPLLSKDTKEHKTPLHNSISSAMVATATSSEKTRDEILAEREAKKLAKQQAKKKNKDSNPKSEPVKVINSSGTDKIPGNNKTLSLSNGAYENQLGNKPNEDALKPSQTAVIAQKLKNINITESPAETVDKTRDKKPLLTKAERRAIQEVQRIAKADAIAKKQNIKLSILPSNENKKGTASKEANATRADKLTSTKSTRDCKVKLFNHLESCRKDSNLFVNNSLLHPVIVRLGEQYAKRTIVGSNARCISFLSALKMVVQDYETPAKKEFARSLETTIKNSVDHLHKCRPLAVSVCNAYKHIKHVLTQLPVDQPESELKEHLCHFVDTYIENQIGKAAQAISSSVQDKISNGDVILTFGCSSLINYIFEEAHRRHVDFRVIVVDSRPFSEGQELLRRLTAKEIHCTYVLINAVGFVMPEVTKILLGAHALLSNGYVMARAGTAQVALVARSFNVPVLVCCETHKFSERFQTDAIVYNELGNPDDLIIDDKCRLVNWQAQNKLSPLNLNYDVTPPELVTAVVTEVAILPCTSVPVILRIKPTEIGY